MKALKFFLEGSLSVKGWVIYGVIGLPAVIYHELCHIIVAAVLFVRINEVKVTNFFKVKDNQLRMINCYVGTNDRDKISSILIAIAPLIGILLSPFLSWYFTLYLVLFNKCSKMSDMDYKIVQTQLSDHKVLLKILTFLKPFISNSNELN